jgi:very-short-patch-repair endonuclease
MAAVLACGPGAVLSHRAAAAALGMRRGTPPRVEVTAPRQRSAARAGLRPYARRLPKDEVTAVDGIPTTTAARTLLDLASVLSPHELERALEQAEALRLADVVPLSVLMERYRGHRGTATLSAILADGAIAARTTRSELEERFLAFVAERGLTRPDVNVPVRLGADEWIEVDCLWRKQRVAVELDGFAHHGTRAAFRRDRRRDRRLRRAGFEPVRVTWWDLHREPDELEADLRALLCVTSARRATP